MTGAFGGLNTALSALRYQQVVLDVANNNVANVNTAGYVRRRAEAGAVAAPDQPAMWSRYVGHGDGVRTQQVSRLVDPLLDARSRRENGTLSYLATQQTVLNRVETGINEPGDDGVTGALKELNGALQDLVSDPSGPAARETVLAKAAAVAAAFKAQSDNITTETADQQQHLTTVVREINDAATELARLNKTIKAAELNHTDVGTLYDQRDLLALDLAKLTGAEVVVQDDGQYNLTVGTTELVTGGSAHPVTVDTSGTSTTVMIDGAAVSLGARGELAAVVDVLDRVLPGYKQSLDQVATGFADAINAVHQAGKGLPHDDGTPASTGLSLFTIGDADNPAASLTLAITDPDDLAAAAKDAGAYDGSNADALSRATSAKNASGTSVESDYAALVTSFGSTVASVDRQARNQQTLTQQVDDEREQLAGVNIDEETLNMVAAQHAYEAASKMLSILDSILDTLINRTGV